MKYSVGMKALALVLAALFLSLAVVGLTGGVVAESAGFYSTDSLENWQTREYTHYAAAMATDAVQEYVSTELTNCTKEILWQVGAYYSTIEEVASGYGIDPGKVAYRIESMEGEVLASGGTMGTGGVTYTNIQSACYWVRLTDEADYAIADMSIENDGFDPIYLRQQESLPLQVTVWLADDAVTIRDDFTQSVIVETLFRYRYAVWGLLAVSAVLFTGCLVYLCFAAGRKQRGDIPEPRGLNRIPLDLYFLAAGTAATLLGVMSVWALESAVDAQEAYTWSFRNGLLCLSGAGVYGAALVVVAFLFAFAAQVKGKTHFWWKNSICGRLCKLIGRGIRWACRGLRKLMGLLPLIWRWLAIAVLMALVPGLCLLFVYAANGGLAEFFWTILFLGALAADIAMVCYGAYAFGILLRGARHLALGELESKIDTRYLRGTFLEFADDLNALADVAVTAAKKQMRSERMKTELITNVSHDIKTPLTSIISYVDILQVTQDEEKRQEYLQILARQSQQMKRLLEDLLEMSKATTGNLTVERIELDAAEAVNQALGEYADKLEKAGLTTVARFPEEPVTIVADGRLTWRVLSNLLSNVVKYALPGTRVYLEVVRNGSWVEVSVKNISREELNISAEELMERFVRGDASRNTEGSGLGLNIAKSLMDAQGGHLELSVDGDLFKAILLFPCQQ